MELPRKYFCWWSEGSCDSLVLKSFCCAIFKKSCDCSCLHQGGTGFAACGVELKAKEARPVMQVWRTTVHVFNLFYFIVFFFVFCLVVFFHLYIFALFRTKMILMYLWLFTMSSFFCFFFKQLLFLLDCNEQLLHCKVNILSSVIFRVGCIVTTLVVSL